MAWKYYDEYDGFNIGDKVRVCTDCGWIQTKILEIYLELDYNDYGHCCGHTVYARTAKGHFELETLHKVKI